MHINRDSLASSERRSFLSRLNTGLASLAAMAGVAMAQKTETQAARWEPTRHPKDAWLDKASIKHRVVFDTTTMEGAGNAIAFARITSESTKRSMGWKTAN